jgi:hypothetical protein
VAIEWLHRLPSERMGPDLGRHGRGSGQRLPGNELPDDADIVATRGMAIGAPRFTISPWLVQTGRGGGGAYAYDWIENLFGRNMHSADRPLMSRAG